jgi:prepilin signal peptidase PulO-like enzyme (type II secretory pathway)
MVPIAGVYGLIYFVSGKKWVGLGDVKLGLALGFILTLEQGFVVLFAANVIGLACAVPRLIAHKMTAKSQIACGPFLIAATIAVFLAAPHLSLVW